MWCNAYKGGIVPPGAVLVPSLVAKGWAVRARYQGIDGGAVARDDVDGRPILVATMLRRTGSVGVQTHVSQVAEFFRSHGQDARTVRPTSSAPLLSWVVVEPSRLLRRIGLENGVRLDRYLHRILLQWALRREFRRSTPLLVYAQDPRSAYAGLKARRRTRAPVVMVVHFNESQAQELVERGLISAGGRVDRSIRAFEAELMPRLDGLIFVSEFMRTTLHAAIPATRDLPSTVVPNFLHSLPLALDVRAARDCISVGSLVDRKNHAYLLHVLASAKASGQVLTLTLVGDGPARDRLHRLARELGVADQVWFAGDRRDVDDLLARHRVYVHSATMENLPYALIEAFRAGLPAVVGDVGGIREVAGASQAARYWDLSSPEDGARMLVGLLTDDRLLLESAAEARQRFASTFTVEVAGPQLLDFLLAVSSATDAGAREGDGPPVSGSAVPPETRQDAQRS